jgi:hypothetical protein
VVFVCALIPLKMISKRTRKKAADVEDIRKFMKTFLELTRDFDLPKLRKSSSVDVNFTS